MRRDRPYTFGYRIMVVIVVFRILLLFAFAYINMRSGGGRLFHSLNLFILGSVIILVAETMVYWYRRFKIPGKAWVHIHVWTTFTVMVLLPLFVYFCVQVLSNYLDPDDFYDFWDTFISIQAYGYWVLIGIGHIFFIATIVKSFQLKDERPDESAGLLDEFIDRR